MNIETINSINFIWVFHQIIIQQFAESHSKRLLRNQGFVVGVIESHLSPQWHFSFQVRQVTETSVLLEQGGHYYVVNSPYDETYNINNN